MTTTKATKKLSGSVAAYLDNKGVQNTLPRNMTFADLREAMEAFDVFYGESAKAKAAALERLETLEGSLPQIEAHNRLEKKALSLLPPDKAAAVRGYAKKRGKRYVDYLAHIVKHPRGKRREDLAETFLKLAEAKIALHELGHEQAHEERANALTMASACLLQAR